MDKSDLAQGGVSARARGDGGRWQDAIRLTGLVWRNRQLATRMIGQRLRRIGQADRGVWLGENQIWLAPFPQDRAALEHLRGQGVRTLVNLHQKRHPEAVLSELGLTERHLPITDMTAPSIEQLRQGFALIDEAVGRGGAVAIHCLGGLGRTGTLAAAYLVHHGEDPARAIDTVRRLRPGAVETPEQVRAIHDLARAQEKSNGPA